MHSTYPDKAIQQNQIHFHFALKWFKYITRGRDIDCGCNLVFPIFFKPQQFATMHVNLHLWDKLCSVNIIYVFIYMQYVYSPSMPIAKRNRNESTDNNKLYLYRTGNNQT